jgi:hypothetical protein
MLQNFFLKTMMKKQLKGVPEDQQNMILGIIEKNPDLFMKIAHDVQERVKGGMSQNDAMMAVMKLHEGELKTMLGK